MAVARTTPPRPDLRVARWLSTAIASSLIGLGSWALVGQHYFGRTSKFGGAEVSLDGEPAVLMGLLYISLGLLPLAIWFRTPRAAAWWGTACAVAVFGCLSALLYG